MNLAMVDKIAKAVLYEGYMLYPYRPSSVKNQQRWNFGVLCLQSYSEAQNGSEAWSMQTEVLIEGGPVTGIEVRIRFLQLVARTVGEPTEETGDLLPGETPSFRPVGRLAVNGRVYQTWQEAVEREFHLPIYSVETLLGTPSIDTFNFPAEWQLENILDASGQIAGVIVRSRRAISGAIEVSAQRLQDGLFKVSVAVRNTTPFEAGGDSSRDHALLSSMASSHTVLGALDGRFVSMMAPPKHLAEIAAGCSNIETWPVLVGEEGERDTMLSSRIILYDYPQIAPESAGDLFDGTEIDEILSLRIMTLTDDEKREMSQSDDRAREMLERTETMPVEQLMKLHGVLRGMRPIDLDSIKEEAQ
jgi:hypothetical protein